MTHDDEDKQVKARLERKPNSEDDGVTLYPITQHLDDIPERFFRRDDIGRVYLQMDEVHDLFDNEAGHRLLQQLARTARGVPPTPKERPIESP